MDMDPAAILTGIGLGVGGVVWLVRLEGRINLTDDRFASLKADIHEIKEDIKVLIRKPLEPRS